MRVLVTGGPGFIGQPLVGELVAKGHEVTVWSRRPAVARASFAAQVQVIGASLDESTVAKAVDQQDAIINLAGENVAGRWSRGKKKEIRDSRLDLTTALSQALLTVEQPPSIFISASAVGFYGTRGDEVLTEDSPMGTGFLAEVCRDWEQAALAAKARARVHCIRIGVVLGPGGGMLAKLMPLFKLGLGGPVGDGRQYLPWIHLDDIVGVLLHVLANDPGHDILTGTAPEPVTMHTFAKTYGRALGRPALLPAPKGALKLILGEGADLALNSQRAIPARLTEAGFAFRYENLDKALNALT